MRQVFDKKTTFKRLTKNKPKAEEWIHQSFLSEEMKIAYLELMERRFAQMEG